MSRSGSIIASLVGRLPQSRDRREKAANDLPLITEEHEEEIVDIFKVQSTASDCIFSVRQYLNKCSFSNNFVYMRLLAGVQDEPL